MNSHYLSLELSLGSQEDLRFAVWRGGGDDILTGMEAFRHGPKRLVALFPFPSLPFHVFPSEVKRIET